MPVRLLFLVTAGLAVAACATVTQGLNETVAVSTPGASDARCTLTNGGALNLAVTAPAQVSIRKARAPIMVSCVAQGRTVARTFSPAYASAARIQTPGGYLADAMTGAMWEYPHDLVVPFNGPPGMGR